MAVLHQQRSWQCVKQAQDWQQERHLVLVLLLVGLVPPLPQLKSLQELLSVEACHWRCLLNPAQLFQV